MTALRAKLDSGEREWREQLTLKDEAGARVLLWACTPLPDVGDAARVVIVFDDITALLNAQRSAAWGEVARRLAHEIKNPLTPIQLSAEQLRRQLLRGLDTQHARVLERATHTIVQQVDAIKQMVNAFSEYARAPEVQLARFSLNQLAAEMVELYRLQDPGIDIAVELDPQLREIEADRGRVRQILANLLSNAIEALGGVGGAAITVRTRWVLTAPVAQAEITVSDNGPGFREDILGRAFEPYVTSKPRGTGLGLAIVKRIVEEHGGRIERRKSGRGRCAGSRIVACYGGQAHGVAEGARMSANEFWWWTTKPTSGGCCRRSSPRKGTTSRWPPTPPRRARRARAAPRTWCCSISGCRTPTASRCCASGRTTRAMTARW